MPNTKQTKRTITAICNLDRADAIQLKSLIAVFDISLPAYYEMESYDTDNLKTAVLKSPEMQKTLELCQTKAGDLLLCLESIRKFICCSDQLSPVGDSSPIITTS